MSDSDKLVRQQFGSHADAYASSDVHAKGPSLARLVELVKPQRDWLVLDVSTGAGHMALAMAPHVQQVMAVDVTPEMLETARRLASERGITNIELRMGDAQALFFPDNMFDLVTNRIALHHYADARLAVQEMARVCKPGRLVALADNIVPPDKQTAGYINHFEKLRDPSHQWAFPSVRLEAYFADAHLKVEHVETIRKEMAFEPWADRMGASAEVKAQLKQRLSEAPESVREFLAPRSEGDRMYFTLTEAIIVGRK